MNNTKFDLKDYIPVNQRLTRFYNDHPQGRINTSIIEHDRESGFVVVRAEVYKTPEDSFPAATGHAFELRTAGFVNRTSYIENCETSAVGRALALMGYEIGKSIASREELEKVERMSDPATVLDFPVERQNGHYVVANRFKVTKPNGKVECDCGIVGCQHIEAVRVFATSAN